MAWNDLESQRDASPPPPVPMQGEVQRGMLPVAVPVEMDHAPSKVAGVSPSGTGMAMQPFDGVEIAGISEKDETQTTSRSWYAGLGCLGCCCCCLLLSVYITVALVGAFQYAGSTGTITYAAVDDLCSYQPQAVVGLRVENPSFLELRAELAQVRVDDSSGQRLVDAENSDLTVPSGSSDMTLDIGVAIPSAAAAALGSVVSQASRRIIVDMAFSVSAQVSSAMWPSVPFSYSSQLHDMFGVQSSEDRSSGSISVAEGPTERENGPEASLESMIVTNSMQLLNTEVVVRVDSLQRLLGLRYSIPVPGLSVTLHNGTAAQLGGGGVALLNASWPSFVITSETASRQFNLSAGVDRVSAQRLAPWLQQVVTTVHGTDTEPSRIPLFILTMTAPSSTGCMVEDVLSHASLQLWNGGDDDDTTSHGTSHGHSQADQNTRDDVVSAFKVSGLEVLPAGSTINPHAQLRLSIRTPHDSVVSRVAAGGAPPVALNVAYTPPPGYEALSIGTPNPVRSVFTLEQGTIPNSDGSHTTHFTMGVTAAQAEQLAGELWRAFMEMIHTDVELSGDGADELLHLSGSSVLTELLAQLRYSLPLFRDNRMDLRRPTCSAQAGCPGDSAIGGMECVPNPLLQFLGAQRQLVEIEASSANYLRLRIRLLIDETTQQMIDNIRLDGFHVRLSGEVNCEGPIGTFELRPEQSFLERGKVSIWLEHNSTVNVGECLSRFIAGLDTCIYLTAQLGTPSGVPVLNLSVPLPMPGTSNNNLTYGLRWSVDDFITTGDPNARPWSFTFSTSALGFRIRVALFNPAAVDLTLHYLTLDAVAEGSALGSARTLTDNQLLRGGEVTWVEVELDIVFLDTATYINAVAIAAAQWNNAQNPVLDIVNIQAHLALGNFDFDLIMNMYDVLGTQHLDRCNTEYPPLRSEPNVDWGHICNASLGPDGQVTHPMYNLNVKVVRATFNAEGKCKDSLSSSSFICSRGTDSDPFVEVMVTAHFENQPAGTQTSIAMQSGHLSGTSLTTQCSTSNSDCDWASCSSRSGDILCANCRNAVGTCWGYPDWNYVAAIGPLSEAEAQQAQVTLKVMDYDSISGSDEIGRVVVSCPTVSAAGATCQSTVALSAGGLVTYEMSLYRIHH